MDEGKDQNLLRPYSPKRLAERWDCSDQHIRDLCRGGQLGFFRIGNMIRIPDKEVNRFEQCGSSNNIEISGTQSAEKMEIRNAYPCVLPTVRKPTDDSVTS